jgi:hypothetical protein
MTDPEIEDLLRRYRPAGPPPDLRGRVMTEAAPVGRTWPWAAAAAVLLATVVGLNLAAEHTYDDLRQGVLQTANTVPPLSPLDPALEDDELFRRTMEIARRVEQTVKRESQAAQALSWP